MKKFNLKKLSFIDKDSSTEIDWSQVESLFATLGKKRPFHKASRLRRSFDNSYSFCLVLFDGKLIGCGRSISDGQVHGWIHDLIVRPDFQEHGIGTTLLRRLIGQLKNIRYIGLLCTNEHIPFYEKNGFQSGTFAAMTMRQKTR